MRTRDLTVVHDGHRYPALLVAGEGIWLETHVPARGEVVVVEGRSFRVVAMRRGAHGRAPYTLLRRLRPLPETKGAG